MGGLSHLVNHPDLPPTPPSPTAPLLCWHLGVSDSQPGVEDRPWARGLLSEKSAHPSAFCPVTSHLMVFISLWISSTLPATPA